MSSERTHFTLSRLFIWRKVLYHRTAEPNSSFYDKLNHNNSRSSTASLTVYTCFTIIGLYYYKCSKFACRLQVHFHIDKLQEVKTFWECNTISSLHPWVRHLIPYCIIVLGINVLYPNLYRTKRLLNGNKVKDHYTMYNNFIKSCPYFNLYLPHTMM